MLTVVVSLNNGIRLLHLASMAAALAEMALEEVNKDLDDDNEFVNDNGIQYITVLQQHD